jgi:hypothetical protein
MRARVHAGFGAAPLSLSKGWRRPGFFAYHPDVKRPLPHIPHGPRRRRAKRSRLIFACPRVSPEWELGMLHVLMKPKPLTRSAVEHRKGEQAWTPSTDASLEEVLSIVRERLQTSLVIHRHAEGEYHFLIEFTAPQRPEVLALAQLLSRRLPDLWFVIDRLFVNAGVFHRRQFGYKLNLVPATNVHLPRAIRAALRGVL